MTISPLQIMLIGFDDEQHQLMLDELLKTGIPARLNILGADKDNGDAGFDHAKNDIVFFYCRKQQASPLLRYLHKRNPDCIVVEVLPPQYDFHESNKQALLQSCKVIYAPEREEFEIALEFVLQYSLLKKDFRRSKSMLRASEARVLKLVNSSTQAVACLSQGKFVHANMAFLALFSAESLNELARFPLMKLIHHEEKDLFADYLTLVNKNENIDIDLTLSMKKLSGAPFSADISVAPAVYKGQRCYQMWVKPINLSPKTNSIPVAKALNVWDLPLAKKESVAENPFDKVIGLSTCDETEKRIDALLNGAQQDGIAKLNTKEIYDVKQGALNSAWITLDVDPDKFKEVNLLLARMGRFDEPSQSLDGFWEQLLFRLVFDALIHEKQSRRLYYIGLSVNAVRNKALMSQLVSLATTLGKKSRQIKIVFDAGMSMDLVPQLTAVVGSLRAVNCGIVLDNFSVDTVSLYLYRKLKPDCVFFDKYWLESLREREDGCLFLWRFVQQIESKGISAMLPQRMQKRQDRLLVLSGASFGQEKTSKDCA